MHYRLRMKTAARAVSLALALGATSFSANAVLERAGPVSVSPNSLGYPSWYQDTTGLAVEFCAPKNASEVAGGWCLLLPGDVPTVPEVFPRPFFDEHFYFAASANLTSANAASKALLVLAEEAAFATGPAIAGDQITFSRIRVKLTNVPVSGVYRFIHPYGEELLEGVAGDVLFFTDDVGVGCAPGNFDCSLSSRLGPFLLPSATPGGAEMPALTAANPQPDTDPAHFGGAFAPTPYPGTGNAYIADPARIGPVTGSPLPNFIDSTGASRNHNIFRIEGPAGSALGTDPVTGAAVDWIETTDFNLMGRVMTGAIPGRIAVQRASYARPSTTQQKLEVFATAEPTTQGRLPAQPKPAVTAPQLTFFNAPCTPAGTDTRGNPLPPFSQPIGAIETQMFSIDDGTIHWGQTQPTAIPLAVCVKDSSARDANGNIVPVYVPRDVADEVGIGEAYFDPNAGTLTVQAISSDQLLKPTLTLAYGKFRGDLPATGTIVVPNLIAAPANVTVLSTAKGFGTTPVSTNFLAGVPAGGGALPVAANDTFTFAEDTAQPGLAVLANDQNVAGGTVAITAAPRIGTAAVNADGTISYTPNLNASGADQLSYTVTVAGKASNTATVTLNITPVNDAPSAVNDSTGAVRGWLRKVNVLANDTDPDGATDLASATLVTGPAAGTTVSGVTCSGAICSFTPSATAGSVTFTYRAVDKAGVQSANAATVTVNVAATEQINFSRAEYTRASSRLRVIGTVAPTMGQTIDLVFVNSAGLVVGNITTGLATDALGNWTFDQGGIALPAGAISVRATSHNSDNANTTVRAQTLSIK